MADVLRVCLDAASVFLVFHRNVAEDHVLHAALTDRADRAAVALLKNAVLNKNVPRAARVLSVWLHCHAIVAVVDGHVMDVDIARATAWVDSISIMWLFQRARAGVEIPVARNVDVGNLSSRHSIQRHLWQRI